MISTFNFSCPRCDAIIEAKEIRVSHVKNVVYIVESDCPGCNLKANKLEKYLYPEKRPKIIIKSKMWKTGRV